MGFDAGSIQGPPLLKCDWAFLTNGLLPSFLDLPNDGLLESGLFVGIRLSWTFSKQLEFFLHDRDLVSQLCCLL